MNSLLRRGRPDPHATVCLFAPHVANYLIESMRLVMSGESPERAFGLHNKRGRKEQRRRDYEIALFVESRRAVGISLDNAFHEAADKFLNRTEIEKQEDQRIGTIKTAYQNGMISLDFVKSCEEQFGDSMDAEVIDNLYGEWVNN